MSWIMDELMLALLLRFFECRASKVKEKALFPHKKGRHTKQSLGELIKRSEKDYVDFQEAWVENQTDDMI